MVAGAFGGIGPLIRPVGLRDALEGFGGAPDLFAGGLFDVIGALGESALGGPASDVLEAGGGGRGVFGEFFQRAEPLVVRVVRIEKLPRLFIGAAALVVEVVFDLLEFAAELVFLQADCLVGEGVGPPIQPDDDILGDGGLRTVQVRRQCVGDAEGDAHFANADERERRKVERRRSAPGFGDIGKFVGQGRGENADAGAIEFQHQIDGREAEVVGGGVDDRDQIIRAQSQFALDGRIDHDGGRQVVGGAQRAECRFAEAIAGALRVDRPAIVRARCQLGRPAGDRRAVVGGQLDGRAGIFRLVINYGGFDGRAAQGGGDVDTCADEGGNVAEGIGVGSRSPACVGGECVGDAEACDVRPFLNLDEIRPGAGAAGGGRVAEAFLDGGQGESENGFARARLIAGLWHQAFDDGRGGGLTLW